MNIQMSFLKSSKFKNSIVTKNMSNIMGNKDDQKSPEKKINSQPIEEEIQLIRTRDDSEPPTPDPITDKLRENVRKYICLFKYYKIFNLGFLCPDIYILYKDNKVQYL